MDRQSLIGFVLIALIVMGWMFYNQSAEVKKPAQQKTVTAQTQETAAPAIPEQSAEENLGTTFAPLAAASERTVTIETDLLKAKISSKGGTIAGWELKKFKSWRGEPVQLIKPGAHEYSLSFISSEGKKVDTRKLNFDLNSDQNIKISGDKSFTLTARMNVTPNSVIERTYTFYGNRYDVPTKVTLINMESIIPSRRYDLTWKNGLKYQEENSVDESNSSIAVASLNGTVEELDAVDFNVPIETKATGIIDYIGVRSKYFLAAIKQ
ncbi:MAG: membrane protein insertase YidC, partial [Bacteroidota bacterium]